MQNLEDISLAEIMTKWPSTIRLFIDRRLHCVGCPIAPFHTLSDAALEHGIDPGHLIAAVEARMKRERLTGGRA